MSSVPVASLSVSEMLAVGLLQLGALFIFPYHSVIDFCLGRTCLACAADGDEGEQQGAAAKTNNRCTNWQQKVSFDDLLCDDGGVALQAEGCLGVRAAVDVVQDIHLGLHKRVVFLGVSVVDWDHHSDENLNETTQDAASDVPVDHASPFLGIVFEATFESPAAASRYKVEYTEGEAEEEDNEGGGNHGV